MKIRPEVQRIYDEAKKVRVAGFTMISAVEQFPEGKLTPDEIKKLMDVQQFTEGGVVLHQNFLTLLRKTIAANV